jgi:hypothetical protein
MPKTPEGKAISSRNALKHGLNSNQLFVLQNENPEAWNALLEETTQEFQPETPFEHRIIREIAFTKWRLQRAWHIEQSLMNNEMDTQAEGPDTKYEDLKETSRQGFAFRSPSDNSKSFANLDRYQTRLERAYHRAVKGLRELRENRKQKIAKRTESSFPTIITTETTALN